MWLKVSTVKANRYFDGFGFKFPYKQNLFYINLILTFSRSFYLISVYYFRRKSKDYPEFEH